MICIMLNAHADFCHTNSEDHSAGECDLHQYNVLHELEAQVPF